jgi:hypothetical protein
VLSYGGHQPSSCIPERPKAKRTTAVWSVPTERERRIELFLGAGGFIYHNPFSPVPSSCRGCMRLKIWVLSPMPLLFKPSNASTLESYPTLEMTMVCGLFPGGEYSKCTCRAYSRIPEAYSWGRIRDHGVYEVSISSVFNSTARFSRFDLIILVGRRLNSTLPKVPSHEAAPISNHRSHTRPSVNPT